jgi:hypothetical protein
MPRSRKSLDLTTDTLLVFDQDLSSLKLERPERIAALRRLLGAQEFNKRLTLVVQKTAFVRQYSPAVDGPCWRSTRRRSPSSTRRRISMASRIHC